MFRGPSRRGRRSAPRRRPRPGPRLRRRQRLVDAANHPRRLRLPPTPPAAAGPTRSSPERRPRAAGESGDASCALLDRSSKRAETFPCTSITRRAVSSSASSRMLRSWSRWVSRSTGSAGGWPRVAGRGQTSEGADVAGLAPLGQVRGVQPLTAQHLPAGTRLGVLVLLHDLQLVGRANVLRLARSGTSPLAMVCHDASMGALT